MLAWNGRRSVMAIGATRLRQSVRLRASKTGHIALTLIVACGFSLDYESARPKIASMAMETDYFLSNIKLVLRRRGEILASAAITYDLPRNLSDLQECGTYRRGNRILDLVAMSKALIRSPRSLGRRLQLYGLLEHRCAAGLEAVRGFSCNARTRSATGSSYAGLDGNVRCWATDSMLRSGYWSCRATRYYHRGMVVPSPW